jgi:NAD-dependent deacetylase
MLNNLINPQEIKKILVFSGAGISAESGISTFRDANGLWNNHRIEDVASPEGFQRNPALVLDFYNQRRRQIEKCLPNPAHKYVADLQDYFQVVVVTQNIDDLHERANSKNVIHLHGEITKAHGERSKFPLIDIRYKDINIGDTNDFGEQLRPAIVWFGEPVPMIEYAIEEVQNTDLMIVIGTSLQVYPAAGLLQYMPYNSKIIYIDPEANQNYHSDDIIKINKTASLGMEEVFAFLIESKSNI